MTSSSKAGGEHLRGSCSTASIVFARRQEARTTCGSTIRESVVARTNKISRSFWSPETHEIEFGERELS
jgi:hypothetical protein